MPLVLTIVDPLDPATPVEVEVRAALGTPLHDVRRQLLAAVGRRDGTLYAGARRLGDGAALGAPPLLDGAVLTVDRAVHAEPRGLLELHVLAGPDSGAVHHLTPGEHGIGRAVEAAVRLEDPDVSRLHALLRVACAGTDAVTVHDLGSTNGSAIDDEPVGSAGGLLLPGQALRIGDSRLTLVIPELVAVSARPDGVGHLQVNRPPRHLPATDPLRVTVPPAPTARERSRFPLASLLLPAVAGVALVAITRSPTYLLFILLSPLMALGTFVSERTGGARTARARLAAHAEETAAIEQAVRRAVGEESAARHRAHPGPATLLLTAADPRSRLWERRRADLDFLQLRVGLGTVPSAVEVRSPGGPGRHEDVSRPTMTGVPVTLRLADAGVIGLAGPRERVLPLARSLVAQLACWHSPHHLDLVLLGTGTSQDWEWARWLPHLRAPAAPAGAALLRVGHDPATLRVRIDELLTVLDARIAARGPGNDRSWAGPSTVVVLDGAGALRREPGLARLLELGPGIGLRVLGLDHDLVSLPVECRATVEVTGPVGTRLRVLDADTTTYDEVVADGVSDGWARRFARALAPLRDATPHEQQSALPDSARLLDLLCFDATDPAALETAWRVTPCSTTVVLGVGTDGEPFVIDLAADGPHLLVAGTTGSGKSELLQTLVAGLAIANRPDELCFVLVDYKGGAAFKDCARLPHTVGTVTDLDGHLTERALRSLGAELRRRERVLRAAGCTDLDDYLAAPRDGPLQLPRLVLVVDEFATLVEELPDFIGGLVGIAARGRSLGVHLVLATQRPAGVVSADIRANTGLRIALRVSDPAESLDVVDVRDAADISRATPGRAVLRVGAGAVRGLQAARVGGHAEVATPTSVRAVPWERAGEPAAVPAGPEPDGPTDLARLVDAARQAADRIGAATVPSPWLPPLPTVVTLAELNAGAGSGQGAGLVIGLRDLPGEQRRAPVTFALEGGDHLLVAGSPRSGRSTVLRTLAAGLADRFAMTDLHLFALDGGGGALSALAALPHCGAVVGRDDAARGDRLLSRLAEELERRQRQLADEGLGSHEEQRAGSDRTDRWPWLVLLADGWEGLATTYEQVEHGRAMETLLRLVREGASVGIRVVLSGDRGVLTGRAGSGFRDRLVLRFADPVDYGLAGISPRQVPVTMPPGRALVGPDAHEAQLGVLDQDCSGAAQVAAVDAVARSASARVVAAELTAGPAHPRLHPMRVDPLPTKVLVTEIEGAAAAATAGRGWVLVGVGGDERAPVGLDLDTDGPAFVIAGPPRSGRSSTLLMMGAWLVRQGRALVVIAHRRSPLHALAGEPGVLAVLGAADVLDLDRLLLARPDLVVLADDAETLHETPVERCLQGLVRPDAEGGAALLLAGSSTEMASQFRGLTVDARRARTGLLLGCHSPLDGDLFGVRLPQVDAAAPPGRGTLVIRGRVSPVQVATGSP